MRTVLLQHGRIGQRPTSLAMFLATLCVAIVGLLVPSYAQDGTSRLGADYDIFAIGGNDPAPCAQACAEDPRCKAWNFIKPRGQCRLLHTAVPAMANACCSSGLKPKPVQPAVTDEDICADYAVEALNLYSDNVTAQCGYRGPTWPATFREAYSRCVSASPRRRQVEQEQRVQAVEECKSFAARTDEIACDHYARMAVEGMKTNQINRCGYKGPRWSDRASEHIAFCRATPRTGLVDATALREADLRTCLDRGGEIDQACNGYVQQSLAQVVKAQQLRCGRAFAGPSWTPDQAQHFAFCQARPARDRDALLKQRADALEKCEQDRKRFRFILKF